MTDLALIVLILGAGLLTIYLNYCEKLARLLEEPKWARAFYIFEGISFAVTLAAFMFYLIYSILSI